MNTQNPYLKQIEQALPRLLGLFDTDPLSPTKGMGDRFRWAWKLIDFGNATFQGAAHGLAWLLKHDLLPQMLNPQAALERIDAMFCATKQLTRKNGSLEEAFPYESSFCVTALVAYDLLSTVELLEEKISPETKTKYMEIIRPLIGFLLSARETHAFISNHLATGAAALLKWNFMTDEPQAGKTGRDILNSIFERQSPEGWFLEYEGADPGYQSLCTHYLADILCLYPNTKLKESLERSIDFLWHFAHPDGSFGGLYGSRNTRFYYPSGVERLGTFLPQAKALADYMRGSIRNQTTVTLASIDAPNLIPMFNSYCWAAIIYENAQKAQPANTDINHPAPAEHVPCMDELSWRKSFPQAGLLLDKGTKHYTVVSLFKGGVCYHFKKGDKALINAGVVLKSPKHKLYSTQAFARQNKVLADENTIEIESRFTAMLKKLPSPFEMLVLRCLNITLMKNATIGNSIKNLLVKLLITGKSALKTRNIRTIKLGEDISITDEQQHVPSGFETLNQPGAFSAIHMASQGYWQKQDDLR